MTVSLENIICANGMTAVIASPEGKGPFPVVVLMHERYGFVQHTRDQAARCARDGYFVIAPNFFFRHPDLELLNSGGSRYDMSDPESVELMKVAIETAGKDPRADIKRVAVAGYCQTGRHPLVFASEVPITAAIVWYGAASKREWKINERQPVTLDDMIEKIKCPVFAAFGALDHIIAVEDVCRMRNAFEKNLISYDIHIYAGAPHGWLNDTMPGRYRKPQADAAWAAQQAFLKQVMALDYKADLVSWRFESDIQADYDFSKNVRME